MTPERENGLYRIDYYQSVQLYLDHESLRIEKEICTPIWYDAEQKKGFVTTNEPLWFIEDERFSPTDTLKLFKETLVSLAKMDDHYSIYVP